MTEPGRVAVTGAGGFVGRHLVPELRRRGHDVVELPRDGLDRLVQGKGAVRAIDLDGVDAVVHLAAIADRRHATEAEMRRVNTELTARLVEAAVARNVGRFVFMSSAKVYGESNAAGPWTHDSPLDPRDAYARSKVLAEERVRAVADRLQVSILRPPPIYGPGSSGNLALIERFVDRGVPLPAPTQANRRSVLGVGGLVSAITAVLEREGAEPAVFIPADVPPMSFREIVEGSAAERGSSARFVPVPTPLLRAAERLGSGRLATMIAPLVRDAELAPDAHLKRLGWVPTQIVADGR